VKIFPRCGFFSLVVKCYPQIKVGLYDFISLPASILKGLPMLIAQISDLHCTEAGVEAKLGCENNKNIALAIARVNELSPRPDIVLATGDLTTAGRPEQYKALATLIDPLELPLYIIPGNHDEYRPLLNAFSGKYGLVDDGRDYVHTVIDDGPLRLVSLDTTVFGHHHGAIPEDRASWLDQVLCDAPNKPTLIFMHHPPIETGIWWMDRLGIHEGLDRLATVLGSHSQVIGITAGHLHRTIHGTFAGVPVTVAPTTCYAVDLDIHDEGLPKVTSEPPAMMMHYWHADTLISHTLFLNGHETYDVAVLMRDWPQRLKLMQQRKPIPKALGAIE
jgi:Icc-related predicted phosphoesterase